MVISARIIDLIVAHAREEFPNEACGLLALRGDVVEEFYPTRNAAASPVFFEIDAKDLLKAIEIEDRNLQLGIVHSHTRTKAYPSQTDVGFATRYPDAIYVIVSLASPDSPDLRAYVIADGTIAEQPVQVAA